MRAKLTIVVPTYNRAHHLEKRLRELPPQLVNQADVTAIIFDDGSSDTTPEVIAKYGHPLIRYERWTPNRGLGRNMLRAFESVKEGWLWTLGDDDPAAPDGVATALELINQFPQALAINCDSEGGRNSREYEVTSLPELLAEKEIADILFMSSNLYNMDVLWPYMKVFNQAVGTLAPHLALLLSGLEGSGRPLRFSQRQLTLFHHREQRWSSLEAALGFANMPLYVKDLATQKLVAQSARRNTRWMLRYGLREVKNAADFERWKRSTKFVSRSFASFGAGFTTDLPPAPDGDTFFDRIAPAILSYCPYWLIKTKAFQLRYAHEGESVLFDNTVDVAKET